MKFNNIETGGLAPNTTDGIHLDKFPKGTRLGVEGLEWLRDKSLTEDKLDKIRALNALAKEAGLPLAVLSIAWCLKNDNVSTVILGASKLSQLKENLTAMDAVDVVDQNLMDQIDEILKNRPKMPDF